MYVLSAWERVSPLFFVTWAPIAMILAYVSGVVSTTVQINTKIRSHVYRKHREALINTSNSAPTQAITNGRLGLETDEDLQMDDWGNDLLEHERARSIDADPKRLAALFLLKTREERKITQVALNGIVQDFRGIWRDAMERLQVR